MRFSCVDEVFGGRHRKPDCIFGLSTTRQPSASSHRASISSPIDTDFHKAADVFFREQVGTALTYDDVTLATLYSEILPCDARGRLREL